MPYTVLHVGENCDEEREIIPWTQKVAKTMQGKTEAAVSASRRGF